MAWPAPSPGRPLEAEGDLRSRGMPVLDRIRAYRPARPRHPNGATGRIPDEPHKEDQDMRVFAGIAATAILIAACGGPAAVSTPTPTASPTPTPIPTVANTFKADLKASNENPPITDAESTCSGTATVTFTSTSAKDRKSTRLNSSHSQISYAVFCLKKKNNRGHQASLLKRLTMGAN